MILEEKENLERKIISMESVVSSSADSHQLENQKLKTEIDGLNLQIIDGKNMVEKKDFDHDNDVKKLKDDHNVEILKLNALVEEAQNKLKSAECSLESSSAEFEILVKEKMEHIEKLKKEIMKLEIELSSTKNDEKKSKVLMESQFAEKLNKLIKEKEVERVAALVEETRRCEVEMVEKVNALLEQNKKDLLKAVQEESARCEALKECSLKEHSLAAELSKEAALAESSAIALRILKSSEERSAAEFKALEERSLVAIAAEKSAGEYSLAASNGLKEKALSDLESAESR